MDRDWDRLLGRTVKNSCKRNEEVLMKRDIFALTILTMSDKWNLDVDKAIEKAVELERKLKLKRTDE